MNVFMVFDQCCQISPGLPSFLKVSLYLVHKLRAQRNVPGGGCEVRAPRGAWSSPELHPPTVLLWSPSASREGKGRAGKGCGHPGK